MERAVAERLGGCLAGDGLLPCGRSACRGRRSAGAALLRVWSGFLAAAGGRRVGLLGLIDLSAAFGCVDHNILLERLHISFGLDDTVLRWIRCYLSDRTQQVAYAGQLSVVQPVLYGVPQGSVLGPLLCVLYTAELHRLVGRRGVSLHQCADDCRLCLGAPVVGAASAVAGLSACLAGVDDWLSRGGLRLNASGTRVVWLGSSQLLDKIDIREVPVTSTRVTVSDVRYCS